MHHRMTFVIVCNKYIRFGKEESITHSLRKNCPAYMYNVMDLFLAANAY